MSDEREIRNAELAQEPPPGGELSSFAIRRREVLVAGSALALVPAWANASTAFAGAGSEVAQVVTGPLSVGYLLGSDALERPRFPVPVPAPIAESGEGGGLVADGGIAVPAATLAAGDSRLAGGGVLIRFQGFYPGAAVAGGLRGLPDDLRVDVLVRDEDGVARPFHAWSYRRAAGASPPIRFRSWLDEEDPLVVEIEQRGRGVAGRAAELAGRLLRGDSSAKVAAPAAERLRAELTLGKRSGLPRLQTGVYFLGLGQGVWDVERALPGAGEPAVAGLLSIVMTVESVSADA